MKYWDRIRNFFYRRTLEERLKSIAVKHQVINLHDARTFGIVYDSTDVANDMAVAAFADKLRSQGKEVEILGYVNDKKIESKPGISVFNKKNLTWARVPHGEQVDKFTSRNYDIMIGCFIPENLPLEFIARVSKARWRLGAYAENKTECYDMMVNTGGKSDLNYLLEQTLFFLNQIKYDTK